jgi:hypothetical protein
LLSVYLFFANGVLGRMQELSQRYGIEICRFCSWQPRAWIDCLTNKSHLSAGFEPLLVAMRTKLVVYSIQSPEKAALSRSP